MESPRNISITNNLCSDYLSNFLKSDDEATDAIRILIEDLHRNKEMTVNYVIEHSEFDKILLSLFKFLQSTQQIIVGNSAFILGTVAENDEGRTKIIKLMSSIHEDVLTSLDFFVSLLSSSDSETVMNVAGTLGTLVENSDGRLFVISNGKCFQELLGKVNFLLRSDYLWTSSNAALILARLSIDETGNAHIIKSPLLQNILANLIECLTIDEAGRGMNASFALGRIFDQEDIIKRFYFIVSKSQFTERLVDMVESSDPAFMKNSCFCLSSVMDCETGFELVVSNYSFGRLISLLETLVLLNDDEAVWFCVLTVKSICVKLKGCKLLKKNSNMIVNINTCLHKSCMSSDVKRECKDILDYLKPLEKPHVPCVTLISPRVAIVCWPNEKPKNGFDFKYQLYYKQDSDEVLAYRGKSYEVKINNLEPNTKYHFYLKMSNDIETSEPSDFCMITTDEDYPSEPQNLSALVVTSNQVKVGWDTPEFPNGVIKNYNVQIRSCIRSLKKVLRKYIPKVGTKDKGSIEQTTERTSILSGLQPETKYIISVIAVNNYGRSKAAEIEITTLNSGAHSPEKPNLLVLGRSEIHVTWSAPETPLGRLFRYDVKLNRKKIIYSGTNTYCKVSNLKADTEYSISVVAVTSLGKYESPLSRKRTLKDEYPTPHREPLYSTPPKIETFEKILTPKSRSMSVSVDPKIQRRASDINLVSRRNSEYARQQITTSRPVRILPDINTSMTALSSSFEVQKSPVRMPSHLMNGVILPLPGSESVNSLKFFHRPSVTFGENTIYIKPFNKAK